MYSGIYEYIEPIRTKI